MCLHWPSCNLFAGSPADIPLPPTPYQNTNTAAAPYDSWYYSHANYSQTSHTNSPRSLMPMNYGRAAQHYTGQTTYGQTQSPTSVGHGYSQAQSPTSLMGQYQQPRSRWDKPATANASSFVPHRGSLPGSFPRSTAPHSNQIQQSQRYIYNQSKKRYNYVYFN